MIGGQGHDIYYVDDPGDVIIELPGQGNDGVHAWINYTLPDNVDKLWMAGAEDLEGRGNDLPNLLRGNDGWNFLSGGDGNDEIDGGAGGDRIYGGNGNDVLTGGSGADRFTFHTAPGSGNVDTITDFSVANDMFYLANYAFTAVGPNGYLASAAWGTGTAAADASDRIIYDSATGNVRYDPDGTGSAPAYVFAKVAAGTALTRDHFIIYG